MLISELIHNYTNSIFKILPMKQEQINGANNHLLTHIQSQSDELRGCLITFPQLSNNSYFIRVVATIQGVDWANADLETYRREVFKMLNFLNKAEKQFKESGE